MKPPDVNYVGRPEVSFFISNPVYQLKPNGTIQIL